MTPFRRPLGAPETTRMPAQQPADTLVIPAAGTSAGLAADRYRTGFTTVMKRSVPRRPATRLGLSVTAAISGTLVTSMLNVPAKLRIAATVVGAALPAFMTEPGRFQRQRALAAGLLTVAALFVTFGGSTAFSYFTGKPSVYAGHHPSTATGPWAVVKAYYRDITRREYRAAWALKGPRERTQSYANFVAGYADSGRQIVRKISVSGDQVTFALRSDNLNGTVHRYRITETVTGGKIVDHVIEWDSGAGPA